MENYIVIHISKDKEVVETRLKNIISSLPGEHFIQVHRSYVTHLGMVKAIEGNSLLYVIKRPLKEQLLKTIISGKMTSK